MWTEHRGEEGDLQQDVASESAVDSQVALRCPHRMHCHTFGHQPRPSHNELSAKAKERDLQWRQIQRHILDVSPFQHALRYAADYSQVCPAQT